MRIDTQVLGACTTNLDHYFNLRTAVIIVLMDVQALCLLKSGS